MKRTLTTFEKFSIADFSIFVNVVSERMTGNTIYTSLQPQVQEYNTTISGFGKIVTDAENKDVVKIMERKTLRKEIEGQLIRLGTAINNIAQGDELMLLSSGFPYSQDRKPTPPLTKLDTPKVSQGENRGEICCKTESQPGMKMFNYYITDDESVVNAPGNAGWNVYSYNRIKYTFTDLTPGKIYYIKVGIVGLRGQEVISDVVKFIAQ